MELPSELGRRPRGLPSSELPCLASSPALVEGRRIPHGQLTREASCFSDGSFASRHQVMGSFVQPMAMQPPHSRGHGHHPHVDPDIGDTQLPRREAAPALNGYGFAARQQQDWGFVQDGEELPFSPTPVRSGAGSRATEISCSVPSSRSTDAHAVQTEREAQVAGRRGQARQLQNSFRQQNSGAPVDSAEALTPPRRSRTRSAIPSLQRRLEQLTIPRIAAAGPCIPVVPPPFSLAGRPGTAAAGANDTAIDSAWHRQQFALQLSVETARELEGLAKSWGLGGVGGSRKLEEDVAEILKAIARRVEKRYVNQLLRQWLPTAPAVSAEFERQSNEVSRLEERCADLQDALQAADDDLRQSDNSQGELGGAILGVKELIHSLETQREDKPARSSSGDTALCAVHDTLEGRKQQLAVSELWLRRTREHLDDLRLDLDSRMEAAVSMTFPHLPGGVPSGLRVLSQMP